MRAWKSREPAPPFTWYSNFPINARVRFIDHKLQKGTVNFLIAICDPDCFMADAEIGPGAPLLSVESPDTAAEPRLTPSS
jgi:hypothetical protein